MFGRTMKVVILISLLALPALAMAQKPAAPDTQAQIAALQQAVRDAQAASASAQSAGDNAWMLTSSALVLLMTGPGLALFYGGLVRKKNMLGTMMQSFAMMGLVTIHLGRRGLFAGLRPRKHVCGRIRAPVSCAASALRPTPTTPPRSPSRRT